MLSELYNLSNSRKCYCSYFIREDLETLREQGISKRWGSSGCCSTERLEERTPESLHGFTYSSAAFGLYLAPLQRQEEWEVFPQCQLGSVAKFIVQLDSVSSGFQHFPMGHLDTIQQTNLILSGGRHGWAEGVPIDWWWGDWTHIYLLCSSNMDLKTTKPTNLQICGIASPCMENCLFCH